jgi:hypothetical protein
VGSHQGSERFESITKSGKNQLAINGTKKKLYPQNAYLSMIFHES